MFVVVFYVFVYNLVVGFGVSIFCNLYFGFVCVFI